MKVYPLLVIIKIWKKNTRKNALECKLTLNGTHIKKSIEVKYLGGVLSQNFQFSNHVKHILHKVNEANGMLSNIFKSKFIDKCIKIILYKQLIRPLILYASPCWLIMNSVLTK